MVGVALLLGVQTAQLISLKKTLQPAAAAASTTPTSGTGGTTAPPLPSSLQNLPNMVGGC